MGNRILPNLPDDILCNIIDRIAWESFYNLGAFLRAGKRGYALAHRPSVLAICDVREMITTGITCQIRKGGQMRELHLKCVRAGNTKSIYYEGILTAPSVGLEESIKNWNKMSQWMDCQPSLSAYSMFVSAKTKKPAKCFSSSQPITLTFDRKGLLKWEKT
ncbi:Uncharacterized protein Rs2_35628 [Raphanus sativus]|nr:Uncharacterized protein Rs2_35628 [Raphanus sativus]